MAMHHIVPTPDCATTLTDAVAALPDGATIVFAPGDYHFWPDRAPCRRLMISNTDSRQHPVKPTGLLLEGRRGLTLRGEGARLILHGSMMAIGLLACEDIALSGFTIAHHQPTVIDVTVAACMGAVAEVTVPPVYSFEVMENHVRWEGERSPYTGEAYWRGTDGLDLSQHLRADGSVRRTRDDLFANAVSVERNGPHGLRLRYAGRRDIAPGDVFQMRHTVRDTCGIHVADCRNIAFSDMWIQFMCSMGLVAQCSDTLSFDKVRFEAGGAPFHSASAADMLHFSGCRGVIAIQDCRFINPHDDPINVHGTFLGVQHAEGNRLYLRFLHPQTCGFAPFAPGDMLQLYRADTLLPEGPAHAVLAVDGPTEADPTALYMTLDAPPACPPGVCLVADNASAQPDVTVERCAFASVPTRGVLVSTAGRVAVRDNAFSRIHMPCVYISCDADAWYESGPVRDVRIEENRFTDCGAQAVRIEPTNVTLSAQKVHQNVRIVGNTVAGLPDPVVFARSTAPLVIQSGMTRKVVDCEIGRA